MRRVYAPGGLVEHLQATMMNYQDYILCDEGTSYRTEEVHTTCVMPLLQRNL